LKIFYNWNCDRCNGNISAQNSGIFYSFYTKMLCAGCAELRAILSNKTSKTLLFLCCFVNSVQNSVLAESQNSDIPTNNYSLRCNIVPRPICTGEWKFHGAKFHRSKHS